MKLKIGDKVKLIGGGYSDSARNPLWGGIHGQTKGTVILAETYSIRVKWDGGSENSYSAGELAIIEKAHPMYLQIFTEPQPEKAMLSEVSEDKFYANIKEDGTITYLANLSSNWYWVALLGFGHTSNSSATKVGSVKQALRSPDGKIFEFETQAQMFIWTQKQIYARS